MQVRHAPVMTTSGICSCWGSRFASDTCSAFRLSHVDSRPQDRRPGAARPPPRPGARRHDGADAKRPGDSNDAASGHHSVFGWVASLRRLATDHLGLPGTRTRGWITASRPATHRLAAGSCGNKAAGRSTMDTRRDQPSTDGDQQICARAFEFLAGGHLVGSYLAAYVTVRAPVMWGKGGQG